MVKPTVDSKQLRFQKLRYWARSQLLESLHWYNRSDKSLESSIRRSRKSSRPNSAAYISTWSIEIVQLSNTEQLGQKLSKANWRAACPRGLVET
jgi:hypothetical protein